MHHRLRRSRKNVHRQLVATARDGGITLVLGAGISMGCGVPSWGKLVAALWRRVHPGKQEPPWFAGSVAPPHPLAFQIALEEVEFALRRRIAGEARKKQRTADPIPEAAEMLGKWLLEELYRHVTPPAPGGTLSAVADVLRTDQARRVRRIERVITFNADDLLETAANAGHSAGADPVVWPVSRASFNPRRGECAHGLPPITVYHVHGYLPRPGKERRQQRAAPDTLVFTDSQYWASVASPSSFANRVVTNALYDSHCLFLGLSMTDVNLMRWLGFRAEEIEVDKLSEQRLREKTSLRASRALQTALDRHFWIRPRSSDPTQFVSAHLERRGVGSVEIDDWGPPLEALLRECFVG